MTLGFFEKIGLLFSRPTNFFHDIEKETSLGPALVMYLIVAVVIQAVSYLFMLSLSSTMSIYGRGSIIGLYGYNDPFSMFMPILIIFGLIAGTVGTFICAAILHLFVIIFKGSGDYVDTYKISTYSAVPAIIISVIPFIGGILGGIYAIVLAVLGIRETHDLSTGKAVAVVLIPVGIGVLIAVLIVITLLAAIIGSLGAF